MDKQKAAQSHTANRYPSQVNEKEVRITKKMVENALKEWSEYKPNYKKKCNVHGNDSKYDIYSCIGCRMEAALNAALKGK